MNCETELSGADYIRAMFANTRPDGALTLETEGKEPVTWYMEWTQEEAEQIAARFDALQEALDRLGAEHERWEQSTEGMPEDLLAVWNTYILPYPDHGMDREVLFDISMKIEFGEKLTRQEQAMRNKEVAWLERNALTRLPGERSNPAWVIQRARRYEKLITLHAPKLVVDHEARYLAEEMALYYGAVDIC